MIFLFFLPTDQLQVLKLICRHLYKALRGCKHVLSQVMLVLKFMRSHGILADTKITVTYFSPGFTCG